MGLLGGTNPATFLENLQITTYGRAAFSDTFVVERAQWMPARQSPRCGAKKRFRVPLLPKFLITGTEMLSCDMHPIPEYPRGRLLRLFRGGPVSKISSLKFFSSALQAIKQVDVHSGLIGTNPWYSLLITLHQLVMPICLWPVHPHFDTWGKSISISRGIASP